MSNKQYVVSVLYMPLYATINCQCFIFFWHISIILLLSVWKCQKMKMKHWKLMEVLFVFSKFCPFTCWKLIQLKEVIFYVASNSLLVINCSLKIYLMLYVLTCLCLSSSDSQNLVTRIWLWVWPNGCSRRKVCSVWEQSNTISRERRNHPRLTLSLIWW